MNKFQPTLDQIKDPQQLLKLLRDMASDMLLMGSQIETTQRDSEQSRRQMFAEMDKRKHILSGVKEGAGALVKLGVDQNATLKSNLTATVAPTSANDQTQGYAPGSKWIIVPPGTPDGYICVSAAPGAAIWRLL